MYSWSTVQWALMWQYWKYDVCCFAMFFFQLPYNSSFGVYVILMNLFSLKQDKERSEWTENRVRQSLLTYTSTMYSRCFKSIQYLNLYWIPVAECSYFYSSTVLKYKFEVLKCSFHVVLALVECALWLCSYPLTPPFWLCHSASWQASVADTAAHAHTHIEKAINNWWLHLKEAT